MWNIYLRGVPVIKAKRRCLFTITWFVWRNNLISVSSRLCVHFDSAYDPARPLRTRRIYSPSLGSAQSINQWFTPAAFAQPASFTFGNLARTIGNVRSDWTRNLDFSLFKNFQIKERFQLQFRAEAFNITNTPIFNRPNTTFGSSAFGVVSSQSNVPRQIQLALKLMF